MDPVIVQFDKFSIGCGDKKHRVMIDASDISSIEECHLHAMDSDGAHEFDFVCITLKNGTAVNVSESIMSVMQKWEDGLKLALGVDLHD